MLEDGLQPQEINLEMAEVITQVDLHNLMVLRSHRVHQNLPDHQRNNLQKIRIKILGTTIYYAGKSNKQFLILFTHISRYSVI